MSQDGIFFGITLTVVALAVVLQSVDTKALQAENKALRHDLEALRNQVMELDDRSHARELELKEKIELASPQAHFDRRN